MARMKMSKDDLLKKTKVELIELGKKLKLKGLHSLRKLEVIERILKETADEIVKPKEKVTTQASTIINETEKRLQNFESISSSDLGKDYEPANVKGPLVDDIYIPRNYNETKIVAMAKDPEWIYCYWEVNNGLKSHIDLDQYKVALRVYDVTEIEFNGENAHSFFDLEVESTSEKLYIKVPEPNRSYCIDLGYIDQEGKFSVIARSNIIAIPRLGVSDKYDEHWMTVEELFVLSGGYSPRILSGSFDIEQMMAERLKMAVSSESFISSWSWPSSLDIPSSYQSSYIASEK